MRDRLRQRGADHIGDDQSLRQRRPEDPLLEEAHGVDRSLAVAGENEGACLVAPRNEIIEGAKYVAIGELSRASAAGSLRVIAASEAWR